LHFRAVGRLFLHFLLRKCCRLRRRRCRAVFTLFSGAVDAVSLSFRNRLWHSMLSKALQKAVFCIAKDGLLAAKTWPFAWQNTAYWKPTPAKRTTHPHPPEGRELDMLCQSARICPISHIRPIHPIRVNWKKVIKLPPFGRVGVGCPFGWVGLSFWSVWVALLVGVGVRFGRVGWHFATRLHPVCSTFAL
jgi:hypothetical protein